MLSDPINSLLFLGVPLCCCRRRRGLGASGQLRADSGVCWFGTSNLGIWMCPAILPVPWLFQGYPASSLAVPSYPASHLAVPRLSYQFPGCLKLSCQSPGCPITVSHHLSGASPDLSHRDGSSPSRCVLCKVVRECGCYDA